MKELNQIIARLKPLNGEKIAKGKAICDQLAKPLGALGKMETIYARLYAMFEGNITLSKKVVMVYVADNGIVAEGISANPQETTFIVAQNILKGKTGLCAISQHVGSDVCLVDIGCKKDVGEPSKEKVRYGTRNMLHEPALTKEEGEQAILLGYRKTVELIHQGYTLFGTGEMGIGNTTTSAAVIAAILGLKANQVTGYGAGLTQDMKAHKTQIIQQCLHQHAPYKDSFDVAIKLGGLDLLGMVGTYLACAEYGLPCVIDGLISIAGLLIAERLAPAVLDYCFASHLSTEPAYALVCEDLGLDPMLAMDMRLGEGSGCPLAFFLMENACYTIEHMPTFSEGQLNKEDYIDIRNRTE
ncbi:nicotinate-nucleotide--dimethylbenzimidazole phosphoribosyltransferase [Streptococcus cuniculi]|uniref:Nicotinate-nucleotide--dimethylbenzimidazole phosphoribosyltransferase n=1 Tax=Streptococcus cuniculi TaxID=1432788 RepID=A0A4Y9JDP0_9STRE|nr:nicotinate-nucleotide--dimethylbenzimidazole phosphoribosyltransferase [Streptococcus cuniculi]MBF0777611.1 nicotinate-nucleotide--dimethylbenzimidazole phosphoribosyltransferase [Streptococcus cuniculi]TFU98651.1 nicotinate-nucleotide--dimethylbenzimidazole phosphoribosyltransferase [Streptococcus cuniculi]